MIDWIAGNWAKPWRCLVDHDGVFDDRLMSYSTENSGSQHARTTADLGEPGGFERFNPDRPCGRLVRADPGGALRPRLPRAARPGHGRLRRRLQRRVPSELLDFPDENHWVLKPQNSVQWYATVEAWMKRWLGG